MFYKLDTTRITLHEYWRASPHPNVESLAPFRVPTAELPEEAQAKFRSLHGELQGCGFHSPVCYRVNDAMHQTDVCQAVYRHESGQAFARVHYRVWNLAGATEACFFTTITSCCTDGTTLVSTTANVNAPLPPSCRVNRSVGTSVGVLWESHQNQLGDGNLTQTVPVRTDQELGEVIQSHHGEVCNFYLRQGMFLPMSEAEQAEAGIVEPPEMKPDDSHEKAAILAEITRLQEKSSSWISTVVVLGISVVLFMAMGAIWWSWEFLLFLLPILFIHELGHYLAMRVFRYRNVKMFFIPLFGAAVSGQHYNVAGWKKVIVSLMGPLPGILLATGLGILGIVMEMEWLVNGAVLALIINGFNLLPILPLDGGWVMHSLLFSRHYVLDAGFRVLAVAALMIGSLLIGARILFFFGVFMAMGLPMAFRMVRVVETLRRKRVPVGSPDAQTIPAATAEAIVSEVRGSFPKSLNNKTLAQITVQTFEALNARSPGCLATLFLGGVHLGSFLFTLAALAVFVVAQQSDLGDFFNTIANAPQKSVSVEEIEIRQGADVPDAPGSEKTLISTFGSPAEAKEAYDGLAAGIPPRATLVYFGQSLLLAVPEEDDAARKAWFAQLKGRTNDVHISTELTPSVVTLMAVAPEGESAEKLEQTLNAYFSGDGSMFLIPPWHPRLDITPEQETARRTYRKLLQTSDVYDDPSVSRLQDRMVAAYRKGDDKRAAELNLQMREATRKATEDRLNKLRAEANDPIEIELIELYEERPVLEFEVASDADAETDESATDGETGDGPVEESDEAAADLDVPDEADALDAEAFQEHQLQYEAWSRRMGALMGQLPIEGEDVKPGEQRFSATGVVIRTGLYVQLNFLTFGRLIDGPPALVQWLEDQGCLGTKYEIMMGH